MSGHNSSGPAGEHHGGSTKWFMTVWVVLLGLTGIEVFLAYIHLPVAMMLSILLGLSSRTARRQLSYQTLSTIAVTAIILAVAFLVFFSGIARRIQHMVKLAAAVAMGDLTQPINRDSPDELGHRLVVELAPDAGLVEVEFVHRGSLSSRCHIEI